MAPNDRRKMGMKATITWDHGGAAVVDGAAVPAASTTGRPSGNEEIAGRIALALLAPEPGKTDCCPQLPELCTLLLRDVDSLAKGGLGTGGIVTGA